MSVIIRLQNLPWSANALDIRQYFHGLGIPEGGVHIVGGELGDAFIAFSTDEDARQAFMRNNGKIKEVQISLMLSSRTEMQRVIEQARTKSYAVFMQPASNLNPVSPAPAQIPLPAAVPNISTGSGLGSAFDLKKDKSDKKDRRRSRSKSKDTDGRRDRDRKDRRHRSRSRSRDRKARRRDRSRSRNRSRSRDRRRRDDKGKRNDKDRNISGNRDKKLPEVWANNIKPIEPLIQPSPLLAALKFEPANRLLSLVQNDVDDDRNRNGFSPMNMRESWPPHNQNNFINRPGNFQMQNNFEPFGLNNRFQRNFNHRNNREMETDCCIELEPFFGAYGDIRKFFHSKFISNRGIKFINDQDGRRTGITYVQFGDKASKSEAILQDGHLLNGLQVNIRHLDDDTFNEAVDRFVPNKEDEESQESNFKFRSRNITKYFNKEEPDGEEITDFCCLIVDDLPSYCKEQDILHMFALHPLIALILTKRRRGPIAYVKFANNETAKTALEDTTHHVVGDKVVLVRPCKDEDFDEVNKEHDVVLNPLTESENDANCVSITKLPPNTTDKDIADFFSDIAVIPTNIHLVTDDNSEFTGQAFCEFGSGDEANRALNKNEASFGNSTVSVEATSRKDMMSVLNKTPPSSGERESPKKLDIVPPPHMMRGDFGPRRPFLNRNFDGPMRGMGPRFGPRPRMRFPPLQESDEVIPGCTVYMKNVPYKAGTSEILKFFNGYNHTSNVSRRYNPNNTPSDEAKIFFFDPDEASRAVDELHKSKIWDRQIFLRQE